MALQKDERISIISEVESNPSEATEQDINSTAIGLYKEKKVRQEAVNAVVELGRNGPGKLTDTLSKSLLDSICHEDLYIRKRSAEAIKKFAESNPEGFKDNVSNIVNALLEEESRDVQKEIVAALQAISKEKPESLLNKLPDIVELLEDDSLHNDQIHIRESVVHILGTAGKQQEADFNLVLNELSQALEDPWKDVREAGLTSLTELAGARQGDLEPVISQAGSMVLDSEEAPDVRIAAVHFLEEVQMQQPDLVEAVLDEIESSYPEINEQDGGFSGPYTDAESRVERHISKLLDVDGRR